jgi:hypothetical protein
MKTRRMMTIVALAAVALMALSAVSIVSVDGDKGTTIDGINYTFNKDDATATVTGGNNGTMTIPNTVTYDGKTYNVVTIGNGAFSKWNGNMTIPASIKVIENNAFHGASGTVTFENNSQIKTIGNNAFKVNNKVTLTVNNFNCSEETSIGNGNLINDGGYLEKADTVCPFTFTLKNGVATITGYNGSETALVIPKTVFDGKGQYTVVAIGQSAFKEKNITSVTISETVTSIGNYAFKDCKSLVTITLSDSITSIGTNAFENVGKDTTGATVTIPASVVTIGSSAFFKFKGTVTFEDGSKIETIGKRAFNDQNSGVLTVSNFNFTGTLTAGDGNIVSGQSYSSEKEEAKPWYFNNEDFYGELAFGTEKTYVAVPDGDSVKYTVQEAPSGGLTYEYRPWNMTAVVTGYTGTETEIVIPSTTVGPDGKTYAVTAINKNAFKDRTSITGVTIPESVTLIDQYAFSGCTGLTEITIPGSVTTIKMYAFSGCTGLTEITIPGSVETIEGSAFSGCTGLTGTLSIPDTVTYLGPDAFKDCTKITKVSIGSGITEIPAQCFRGTGITSISIPSTVTSIGPMAFYGCSALTGELVLHDGITEIGSQAFYNCPVTSISIGSGITVLSEECFRGTAITSIKLPATVTEIQDGAFDSCANLVDIVIPEGITSIPEDAFWKAGVKTSTEKAEISVTLPKSVTTVSHDAFYWCVGTLYLYKGTELAEGFNGDGNLKIVYIDESEPEVPVDPVDPVIPETPTVPDTPTTPEPTDPSGPVDTETPDDTPVEPDVPSDESGGTVESDVSGSALSGIQANVDGMFKSISILFLIIGGLYVIKREFL